MKKILAITLSILLMISSMSLTAFAAESTETVNVYVTIADKGKLVLSQQEITVSDIDNDGALTVNDALYAAHELNYEGGAESGYSYYTHPDYGLSLGKLWGDESGSFGYYINNNSAWSLADTVNSGDYINAFVYADGQSWSDTYCYFDVNTVTAEEGSAITVTLSCTGYDANNNWAPYEAPVANAEITVDGVKTGVATDENGKAVITIEKAGTYVISAASDSQILVPPVVKATVSAVKSDVEDDTQKDKSPSAENSSDVSSDQNNDTTETSSPKTGDSWFFTEVALLICALFIAFIGLNKKTYDK